jgi:hypothetical protein
LIDVYHVLQKIQIVINAECKQMGGTTGQKKRYLFNI